MLPPSAKQLLTRLHDAGFEAYAVGGCVRDFLRGVTPEDIDITTAATPHEILTVFENLRTIPTGLQHGTVTVLVDGVPFEITTFRTDGTYSDGRHPDSVAFTTLLTEDLARRDFTVNAIAMREDGTVIDPFGGAEDLRNGILRCVGDPEKRFQEDALRIARLFRFMGALGFDVDAATVDAAVRLCDRLDLVAAERKRVELTKALVGEHFLKAATTLPSVLCAIVPALSPLVDFDQHNPHHAFDIYTHTVRAVDAAVRDPIIRLAVLLHDIGKPNTFHMDENGVGHFYGHPAHSNALAEETLHALRFDNATIHAVLPLVAHHDIPISAERRLVKRRLAQFGETGLRRLLAVKQADAAGCFADSVPPDFDDIHRLIDDLLAEEACVSLRDLAIGGGDLLTAGFAAGPLIGTILNTLLQDVVEERLPNEREVLLHAAKERWS